MSENFSDRTDQLPPEDVDSAPTSTAGARADSVRASGANVERVLEVDAGVGGVADHSAMSGDANGASDPNDEIPVPIAMWPSEIDERAQVVEALRGNAPPPRTDTQVDPTTEV